MKRANKCRNCGELAKGCKPEIDPECELRLPVIMQLVEQRKIDAFQRCLQNLGMKIKMIGSDDFDIVMASGGEEGT